MTADPPPGSARAVLFDLDGTLVDSRGDLAAAVNHARGVLALSTLSEATVVGFVGDGLAPLLARAFPGAGPDRLRRAEHAFRRHYAAHSGERTTVYPGMREVVARLHRDGRPLAVVTNKPDSFVDPLLDALALREYFDVRIGERPERPRKPAPDMVLHACDALGVDPGEAWLVGDGPQDLAAGRAAGVRVCAVAWGYGHVDGDGSLVPDARVDRPARLLDVLGVGDGAAGRGR